MDDEREDDSASEGCACGDEDLREREPAAARGFDCRRGGRSGVGLLREEDDLATIGAISKMGERGDALVLGQDVFSERAELVGREMLAGLEIVSHNVAEFPC